MTRLEVLEKMTRLTGELVDAAVAAETSTMRDCAAACSQAAGLVAHEIRVARGLPEPPSLAEAVREFLKWVDAGGVPVTLTRCIERMRTVLGEQDGV